MTVSLYSIIIFNSQIKLKKKIKKYHFSGALETDYGRDKKKKKIPSHLYIRLGPNHATISKDTFKGMYLHCVGISSNGTTLETLHDSKNVNKAWSNYDNRYLTRAAPIINLITTLINT